MIHSLNFGDQDWNEMSKPIPRVSLISALVDPKTFFERWAATTFFGKTSTPFFSILSIPSYTICNKQYTICNSRAYFPLPRLVFDGWRLLSEALFCNRTTCPLITRLRLSQLFCPLLNNWYTFQIDDQNKDKNRQLTNIGYSWTLPWLKNCSVA